MSMLYQLPKSLIKWSVVTMALLGVAACSCRVPPNVTSIQKADKKLTCRDVIFEINETEHYRSQASTSRKISMGEALMPTCWMAGYVDGEEAISAADARIEYLGHIYDLLDCGGAGGAEPAAAAGQPGASGAVAPGMLVPGTIPQSGAPTKPTPASTEKYRKPVNSAKDQLLKDEQGVPYRPLYVPEQQGR